MFIARDVIPLEDQTIFVGLGTFFCWITLMKYFEHSPEYSFFTRTVSHAGPDVIRNLVNVLPFFVGFAMLGMSIFWQGYRFRDPSIAFFSLFCIMLGDEISNTFNEIMQIDYLFGGLYMFTFVFFSMQVMMNIFLIIIGDSYSIVKDTHKYDWLEVTFFFSVNSFQQEKAEINEDLDKKSERSKNSLSNSDSESNDSSSLSPRKRSKDILIHDYQESYLK